MATPTTIAEHRQQYRVEARRASMPQRAMCKEQCSVHIVLPNVRHSQKRFEFGMSMRIVTKIWMA